MVTLATLLYILGGTVLAILAVSVLIRRHRRHQRIQRASKRCAAMMRAHALPYGTSRNPADLPIEWFDGL